MQIKETEQKICNDWIRTGKNVMKKGEYRIIRFVYSSGNHYVLDKNKEYVGTFLSPESAINASQH